MARGIGFWALQIIGWLLLVWLALSQGVSALVWEQALEWGLQEGPDQITEVGGAFFYGFAFGDLVVYLPLLAAGLVGHALRKTWGAIALAAALGITAYWPIVSLAAAVAARDAAGWALQSERLYWILLPPFVAWAAWGLLQLTREGRRARAA